MSVVVGDSTVRVVGSGNGGNRDGGQGWHPVTEATRDVIQGAVPGYIAAKLTNFVINQMFRDNEKGYEPTNLHVAGTFICVAMATALVAKGVYDRVKPNLNLRNLAISGTVFVATSAITLKDSYWTPWHSWPV